MVYYKNNYIDFFNYKILRRFELWTFEGSLWTIFSKVLKSFIS